MSDYRDVQTAVRVEKLRIWFAWICGTVILFIVAAMTRTVPILGVITQVLLIAGFLALTFALFRMTGALNRKAAAARKEVLGDQ